jgi:hypothetical protein
MLCDMTSGECLGRMTYLTYFPGTVIGALCELCCLQTEKFLWTFPMDARCHLGSASFA